MRWLILIRLRFFNKKRALLTEVAAANGPIGIYFAVGASVDPISIFPQELKPHAAKFVIITPFYVSSTLKFR